MKITPEGEIRLSEFEERTGFPAKATLEELECLGGKYFSSKPVIINGEETRREYVFLDPTGTEQEIYIWKRQDNEEIFRIHLESRAINKY